MIDYYNLNFQFKKLKMQFCLSKTTFFDSFCELKPIPVGLQLNYIPSKLLNQRISILPTSENLRFERLSVNENLDLLGYKIFYIQLKTSAKELNLNCCFPCLTATKEQ